MGVDVANHLLSCHWLFNFPLRCWQVNLFSYSNRGIATLSRLGSRSYAKCPFVISEPFFILPSNYTLSLCYCEIDNLQLMSYDLTIITNLRHIRSYGERPVDTSSTDHLWLYDPYDVTLSLILPSCDYTLCSFCIPGDPFFCPSQSYAESFTLTVLQPIRCYVVMLLWYVIIISSSLHFHPPSTSTLSPLHLHLYCLSDLAIHYYRIITTVINLTVG